MKQHQDVSNNDNVIIYGKIKDSTNSSTIQIVIMKKNIDSNGVVVTISIIKIIQIKINITDISTIPIMYQNTPQFLV